MNMPTDYGQKMPVNAGDSVVTAKKNDLAAGKTTTPTTGEILP
jgi:hypothetical protein